jgi:hypothetical protein
MFLVLFFKNISNNYIPYSPLRAGAIRYCMKKNNHYNISYNTFLHISTNKSVLVIFGYFSSLSFTYNSFYNVSSVDEGGVFFFFNFFNFFLFLIFLFYLQ